MARELVLDVEAGQRALHDFEAVLVSVSAREDQVAGTAQSSMGALREVMLLLLGRQARH